MTDFKTPEFEHKICAPTDVLSRLTDDHHPIVFTNGCFDVLHRGHVTYLAQAKALGRFLVLALNTDESVKRLGKGDDRPVNRLENRLAVIAALASVDLVTWFDDDTPANLIELIQPDILVKGGDWAIEDIIGSAQTLARCGSVYSIPFLYQTSTTAILNKIRGNINER